MKLLSLKETKTALNLNLKNPPPVLKSMFLYFSLYIIFFLIKSSVNLKSLSKPSVSKIKCYDILKHLSIKFYDFILFIDQNKASCFTITQIELQVKFI